MPKRKQFILLRIGLFLAPALIPTLSYGEIRSTQTNCQIALRELSTDDLTDFEETIQELVQLRISGALEESDSLNPMTMALLNQLLQEKRLELEKKFGRPLASRILKEVQRRVNARLIREDAESANTNSATDPSSLSKEATQAFLPIPQYHHHLLGLVGEVSSSQYSPDGVRIITTQKEGPAKIWNSDTGEYLFSLVDKSSWKERLLGGRNDLNAMYSPDGKFIVTITTSNRVYVWKADSGELLHIIDPKIKDNNSVLWKAPLAISPDSNLLAVAIRGKPGVAAMVFRLSDGIFQFEIFGHGKEINSLTFSPDSKALVTTGSEGITYLAKVWSMEDGHHLFDLLGHTNSVQSAIYTPDNKYIITAAYERKSIKVWDASNGEFLYDFLKTSRLQGQNPVISSDGRFLTLTSASEGIFLFEFDPKNLIWSSNQHSPLKGALRADFSPNQENILLLSSPTPGRPHPVEIWPFYQKFNVDQSYTPDQENSSGNTRTSSSDP